MFERKKVLRLISSVDGQFLNGKSLKSEVGDDGSVMKVL